MIVHRYFSSQGFIIWVRFPNVFYARSTLRIVVLRLSGGQNQILLKSWGSGLMFEYSEKDPPRKKYALRGSAAKHAELQSTLIMTSGFSAHWTALTI